MRTIASARKLVEQSSGIPADHVTILVRDHPTPPSGGLGDGHVGAVGAHGFGLHQHASHRFGGYGPGYGYYNYPDCYDWYYLHPDQPLPLSCS